MFISLIEHRKDRNSGQQTYANIKVNVEHTSYIQEKSNGGKHTYIALLGGKFMFVKESFEEIEKLMKKS